MYVRDTILDYSMYPILTTIVLNTIILMIIGSIKQQQDQLKADNTIASLNIENLTAQKQTLTQQLQPHFLFNALSVLKSIIGDDPKLAESYTVKLSEFLRYSVDSHSSDLVKVREEMQFVNNYIDLQKIRFGESFSYTSNIPEDMMEQKVPVFAIQTLIENAFKHNYFTEANPLNLVIEPLNDCLQISNNIGSIKLTERSGTGLANLKKRYELYGNKEIAINQSESQFAVTIPLIMS